MSILVNKNTRVICQGITGSGGGAFHTKGCLDYGTKMVGGTSPARGAQKIPMACPFLILWIRPCGPRGPTPR